MSFYEDICCKLGNSQPNYGHKSLCRRRTENAGVENVKVKSCYCCGEEERVVFIMEGDNRDAVLEAFLKVNVPVASIMEAEEVPPEM